MDWYFLSTTDEVTLWVFISLAAISLAVILIAVIRGIWRVCKKKMDNWAFGPIVIGMLCLFVFGLLAITIAIPGVNARSAITDLRATGWQVTYLDYYQSTAVIGKDGQFEKVHLTQLQYPDGHVSWAPVRWCEVEFTEQGCEVIAVR